MNADQALLKRVEPSDVVRGLRPPVDAQTLASASEIVDGVRREGERAVRSLAVRFGELSGAEPLVLGRDAMRRALDALEPEEVGVLERSAERIASFARAQLEALSPLDVGVPGGRAGHTIEPMQGAGCYAPAGRYPLPSSVLMTAVTARVAGCDRVVVASPGAHPSALAAAAIAGADEFFAVGGAHAVAAMAFGIEGLEPCDVIVGPGNRWVTAAKQLVSGVVGIDMLAGPSELLVIADDVADPALIASDLLAQAEHDDDASAMLVTTSEALVHEVDAQLRAQLAGLSTRETAERALGNGFVCVTGSLDEALRVADRIAAEHVELMVADSEAAARRLRHGGGLFIGPLSAEVAGDYGAGPNHTLPTGGTARFRAGLSVLDFIRVRAWLRLDDQAGAEPLLRDAAMLAQMEGLEAHQRSAQRRLVPVAGSE